MRWSVRALAIVVVLFLRVLDCGRVGRCGGVGSHRHVMEFPLFLFVLQNLLHDVLSHLQLALSAPDSVIGDSPFLKGGLARHLKVALNSQGVF